VPYRKMSACRRRYVTISGRIANRSCATSTAQAPRIAVVTGSAKRRMFSSMSAVAAAYASADTITSRLGPPSW
jgi:hypothetical protein